MISPLDFQAVFDGMTDGFISVDHELRYLFVNRKIGEMVKMDPSSLIGKYVFDVFPEAKGSNTHKAFLQALETKQYVLNTDYYPQLDLWQENHVYPSKEGLFVFIRDITNRKKAQIKLQESEQRYKMLFHSNPLPMWMISLKENCFTDVNSAALNHYEYKREEFLKLSPADVSPYTTPDTPGADKSEFPSGIQYEGNWTHLKKDGTRIIAEVFTQILRDNGKKSMLVLARDVTEQQRTIEALRQSEALNRLIMNSSLDAIVCIDIYGKIKFWNPRAEIIFGYTHEEVANKRLSDIIIPVQYRMRHNKGLEKYRHTGHGPILNSIIEITAVNKQGREFPVQLTVIPVKENDQALFCGFIQDITERKKSEEKLKKSYEELQLITSHLHQVREEEQKRIAREVHDELGQQLTGLKMDVSWLQKKIHSSESKEVLESRLNEMMVLLDQSVNTIRRIASELRPSLLDDIGLVSALEWQNREFEKRFSIHVIFRTTVKEIELETEVATHVFRLYQESLTNIARHSGATKVETNLTTDQNFLYLTISDNGKGFDTSALSSMKTLGILGMRERTQMLKGNMDISSSQKGTTIQLKIPLVRH